ncbi:MAG: hypothetical protein KY444_12155 [Gemmatimonadetes bacterium]|nr:hypothetical protein [Gemmatimonadota bacterium]
MPKRTLDVSSLRVETFTTASEGLRPLKAQNECTDFCDTDHDCSTLCIVPTNVSSPC